jgi:phosphoglucomutase
MTFLGDKKGPRMSTIISSLGHKYFGISPSQLDEEIQWHEKYERDGVIDPVFIDADGQYYVLFEASGGGSQKFYLEDHGYQLPDNPEKVKHDRKEVSNMRSLISDAEKGISEYLGNALENDRIDNQLYNDAKNHTLPYIEKWLTNSRIDEISPKLTSGIRKAIENKEWENLVNAFRKKMDFGTGGIRGLMANDKKSIELLNDEGIDAPIIKGPNTLNNVVLLITSAGVAKFGLKRGFNKIVIGYDSRVRGWDFAKSIAELFLGYGYTVYLFDSPCPYPEVTFAIPYKDIKADMGILISASHNDYRYNGYKLSCGNGSQFDPDERTDLYNNFIDPSEPEDIQLLPLEDAQEDKLIFLGGATKIISFFYYNSGLIDIHKAHRDHIKTFLLLDKYGSNEEDSLKIAYCAFHGAGRIAVPRLLEEVNFKNVKRITKNGLDELNGLFPSFNSDPGQEQQPDPGDPRAAKVAVESFQEEYPDKWDETDILIGTDPDADRCGVVVKVPENQQFLYDHQDYMLMPADDMWALILWFRMNIDKSIIPEETFIVLSHTTSDLIVKLALKNNLGVIKSWVGFAALSAGVRDTWNKTLEGDCKDLVEGRKHETEDCHPFIYETMNMFNGKRSYNLAAMEQSNGFSILGSPPPDDVSLGENGHVRDKDGTFAAVLIAEIAQWAKEKGTNIFDLIDNHLYLDPDIGLFVNVYEPDPLDGEYPGIEGDKMKKAILRRALGYYQLAMAGDLKIGGFSIKSACIYRTGKYDHIYAKTHDFHFPDEGVRFYFDHNRLSHLTIRPSGTSNALRFHIQLHSPVDKTNLVQKKKECHEAANTIMKDIRKKVGAPTGI